MPRHFELFAFANNNMKNILITGGGGPSTEALQKLWSSEYTIYFADADINKIGPFIANEKKLQIPWANSIDFKPAITEIINKREIDLVISQVDEELLLFSEIEKKLNSSIFIIPNATFIETFLDKYISGLSIHEKLQADPNTQLFNSKSLVESKETIVKPRQGRGSRDLFFAKEKSELEALNLYLGFSSKNFIKQDKIEGSEYSVQVINNMNSQIKGIVPIKIHEKKGSTTHGVVDNNEKIIDFCKSFHEKFPTKGTYNIQLILEKNTERIYVFEVNPRVSTTMCVAIYAGLDPLELYFEFENKAEIRTAMNGITLKRYWNNIFSR